MVQTAHQTQAVQLVPYEQWFYVVNAFIEALLLQTNEELIPPTIESFIHVLQWIATKHSGGNDEKRDESLCELTTRFKLVNARFPEHAPRLILAYMDAVPVKDIGIILVNLI